MRMRMNMDKPAPQATTRARLEWEGHVWHVTYKVFPDVNELRVYRVEGDVTTPALGEALQNLTESEGLKLTMTGKRV